MSTTMSGRRETADCGEASNSVLNEGFFELIGSDEHDDHSNSVLEDSFVRRLDQLIQESYQKEVSFVLEDLTLTPRMSEAAIRVFEFYFNQFRSNSKGPQMDTATTTTTRQWDTLIMNNCRQNKPFQRVLSAALQRNLFRQIQIQAPQGEEHFQADQDDDSDSSDDSSSSIPPLATRVALQQNTAELLRDGMVSSFPSPASLLNNTVNHNRDGNDDLNARQQVLAVTSVHSHHFSLKTLILENLVLNETSMKELKNGMTDSTCTLKKLSLDYVLCGKRAFDGFVSAIAQNKSLKSLIVNNNGDLHKDSQIARLISVLPMGLENLDLDNTYWHDQSLQALGSKLSAPDSQLRHVCLSNRKIEDFGLGRPTLAYLLQGMAASTNGYSCCSLESLDLEGCDLNNADFRLLMAAVSRCPRLMEVDLTGNVISSLDVSSSGGLTGFSSNATTFRRSRLCLLDVSENPLLALLDGDKEESARQEQHHLIYLLETFPCLSRGFIDLTGTCLITPYIQHLLDFNESGRRLLLMLGDGNDTDDCQQHGHQMVALSVWSLVLARTVKNFKEETSRQANAIYHLLKGPVLAGRESYY